MNKIKLARVKCVMVNTGTLLTVDGKVTSPYHEKNTKKKVQQLLFCSVKIYFWSFATEYRAYVDRVS